MGNFQKISVQQPSKLYELLDMLYEMEALKSNPKYSVALSYFDSRLGLAQILAKLPCNMQEKWVTKAVTYKTNNDVSYPINIRKVQGWESAQNHGGEHNTVKNPEQSVTNKCTQICSPPDLWEVVCENSTGECLRKR